MKLICILQGFYFLHLSLPLQWCHLLSTHSDEEAPKAYNYAERGDYEQEIKHLKEMVRVLRQRERNLEDQLLEYYGLKEQETAVMELQNRLKVHNMEAKLFNLKIESLQAENRRLEAQLADYAKVVSELEAARTTIKLLKKKLKSETVQNKEQILSLKERVKNMQDQEHETLPSHAEVQLKLQQLEELQEAVNELRKSNYNLQLENSNLAQKLESTQMLANSVLEDQEAEALKVESYQLRQQNEDLLKEIENLKSDRCADLEELVYLRWINACLRYELRNYQPGPGKTVARDLGKSLSPKSEEKAKQLIIEYAFKEGFADKGINITDSDIELLSSSLSYLTDSGEFDDTSIDNSTSNRTDTTNKTKIFGKLRRLLRGKECHRHRRSQSLEITASVGDSVGQSGDSLGRHLVNSSGEHNKMRSSSGDLERLRSLKVDRQDLGGSLRNNDSGSACIYKCLALGRKNLGDLLQENSLNESPGSVQKPELVKYAKALKGSSGESSKFHRRSASHVSFL
ncbi:hypothetical protein NMG60_11002511 [Bertholletia excelsa]